MNKDLAKEILLIAQECSRKIDESIELAEASCSDDDYQFYGIMAGKIMAEIFENITAPIYDEYEDLAPEWYLEMNRRQSQGRRGS